MNFILKCVKYFQKNVEVSMEKCPYCDRILDEGYCLEHIDGVIAHLYSEMDNDKKSIIFTKSSKPLRFDNYSESNSFHYRLGFRKVEDFSIFKNKTFEQLVMLHRKFEIFS